MDKAAVYELSEQPMMERTSGDDNDEEIDSDLEERQELHMFNRWIFKSEQNKKINTSYVSVNIIYIDTFLWIK